MTNPDQNNTDTEVQARRDGLFEAIRNTLAEQGTNVQVAGTAPIQQIVNFDFDGEPWTLTVNRIPQ